MTKKIAITPENWPNLPSRLKYSSEGMAAYLKYIKPRGISLLSSDNSFLVGGDPTDIQPQRGFYRTRRDAHRDRKV